MDSSKRKNVFCVVSVKYFRLAFFFLAPRKKKTFTLGTLVCTTSLALRPMSQMLRPKSAVDKSWLVEKKMENAQENTCDIAFETLREELRTFQVPSRCRVQRWRKVETALTIKQYRTSTLH